MSLYKRGDVWHFDFVVNGRRYRGTTQQTDKASARKFEARERERRALGQLHGPIPTLREATRQWFRSRAEGRRSVATIAQRVKIMLACVDGDKLVSEIGTADVERAIQARRIQTTRQGKGPTNSTVNRDIVDTTLRPILTYCAEILEVPVRKIAWQAVKLPEPAGRDRQFTEAEMTAWREALHPACREVFDFISRYGVRLREAFFPPESYDPATGRVFLRLRKNGKPHSIRLTPEDAAAMNARWGRAVAAGLDVVWAREGKDGLEPISPRSFQSASYNAIRTAKIKDARAVHDLRHHAATEMMRRHGNMKVVQKLLGHETWHSTARYAHADDEDVFEALCHAYGTNGEEEVKSSEDSKDRTGT